MRHLTGYAQMVNLVCDWLTLTEAHAAQQQRTDAQPDFSSAHFLRVRLAPHSALVTVAAVHRHVVMFTENAKYVHRRHCF